MSVVGGELWVVGCKKKDFNLILTFVLNRFKHSFLIEIGLNPSFPNRQQTTNHGH
jgi:hypothetical protein